MRNLYQASTSTNNFHFSPNSNNSVTDSNTSFNNNKANFQFNMNKDSFSPASYTPVHIEPELVARNKSSIRNYIDQVSPKKSTYPPDAPKQQKPMLTSPNRPPPPPLPSRQNNRLAKKLQLLNNSLSNSTILSSSTNNSVYLDPPSSVSSLEFKGSNGQFESESNSVESSSLSAQIEEDFQNYSNASVNMFNPGRIMQQMRAKNSASSSDLLVSYFGNFAASNFIFYLDIFYHTF